MIGSDVVVAGILPASRGGAPAPFAIDYYLQARSPCQHAPGQPRGVCPDSVLAGGNKTANNVRLLAMESRGGVTAVTFTRPVAGSDK